MYVYVYVYDEVLSCRGTHRACCFLKRTFPKRYIAIVCFSAAVAAPGRASPSGRRWRGLRVVAGVAAAQTIGANAAALRQLRRGGVCVHVCACV